jgi:hypothetical protein
MHGATIKKKESISSVEFEAAILVMKRPKIHASFLLRLNSSFPEKLRQNTEQPLRTIEGNGLMLMSSVVIQAHCKSSR